MKFSFAGLVIVAMILAMLPVADIWALINTVPGREPKALPREVRQVALEHPVRRLSR